MQTFYNSCGQPRNLFALYSLLFFILCIVSPGRRIKKVGRDVMDRDSVLFIVLFFLNYLCGLFYYAQGSEA